MTIKLSRAILTCLVTAAVAVPATAQTVFQFPLDAEQAGVASDATGICVGALNDSRDELTVICTHNVANPTNAHIHVGPLGVAGPVVLPFPWATSPMRQTWGVTPERVADLLQAKLYVNVHSTQFGGGEIRGQIIRTEGTSFPLEGGQAVPPVQTDRSGLCIGVLNPLETEFTVGCEHSVDNALAAHIHSAPAGSNGGISFFLESSTAFVSTVNPVTMAEQKSAGKIQDDNFANFLGGLRSGRMYVNVHSPAAPGGEIRGQIPRPPTVLQFSQFGNGGGLTSDIVLFNTSTTSEASGVVRFHDSNGIPLMAGISEGSGSVVVGEDSTEVEYTLSPLGSVTISTDGEGELVQGSATASSDGAVGGVIRFGIEEIGIAGVIANTPLTGAILPVRNSGGVNTGVAIRNPETHEIVVTLELRDAAGEGDYAPGGTGYAEISLLPNGRISKFITELFPDADTTDFEGTLTVRTAQGAFTAIGLELGLPSGPFTTLPVTALSE